MGEPLADEVMQALAVAEYMLWVSRHPQPWNKKAFAVVFEASRHLRTPWKGGPYDCMNPSFKALHAHVLHAETRNLMPLLSTLLHLERIPEGKGENHDIP